MVSHVDQVRELLDKAAELPTCLTKFDLLDEAVRIADTHNDIRLGIEARIPFIHVCRRLLRGDHMAIAFTWCLHQYDRDPTLFGDRDLFDEYGELVGQLANFDAVSRPQIESMFDDLSDRLMRAGRSPAALWNQQWIVSHDLGDLALSDRVARQLRALPASDMWDADDAFHHAVIHSDDDAALAIADAELPAGKWDDDWSSYWHDYLVLLAKRGRTVDLRRWRNRMAGRRKLRDSYYWEFGPLVIGAALGGYLADAVALCGQAQRTIREFTAPLTLLHFCADMRVLFDRLYALGAESVLVRFNELMPGRKPNGRYVVAEVREWLHATADDLAARFDRRNGTDYFAGLLRRRAALQEFAQPPQD